MRHTLEAALVVTIVLVHVLFGAGCTRPPEGCDAVRQRASAAWSRYAIELGAAPEISFDAVMAKADTDFYRYDRECRRQYGIASGVDAEMSDGQAAALISCRSGLPGAEIGQWPAQDEARRLAGFAMTATADEFENYLADFRFFWDRGPRSGPSRAGIYEASNALIATCRVHAAAPR